MTEHTSGDGDVMDVRERLQLRRGMQLVHVRVALLAGLALTVSACSSGKPLPSTGSTPAAGTALDAKTSAAATTALNKGLAAQAAGRLDEASSDYHQALALDPRNKFAFFDLGVIDQAQSHADAAENNYRLALQIDPAFVAALYNLAIVRTAAGSTQEAIELYRRALAADQNNAGAHLNLGFLLIQTGQQEDGAAELARAVKLDPRLATRLSASPTPTPP